MCLKAADDPETQPEIDGLGWMLVVKWLYKPALVQQLYFKMSSLSLPHGTEVESSGFSISASFCSNYILVL